MPTKVIMPQLGESVVEGTVTKWLKEEGEQIEEFESLLEVNTDKVDSEIPSPAAGVLLKILVPEGTTVDAGTIIAWVGEPGEAVPEGESILPAHEAEPTPAASVEPPAAEVPSTGRGRDLGFISPVVARLAREQNVDLTQVKGSGQKGRITKKDVLAFIESGGAVAPQAEPAAWETPGEGDLFRPTELVFASGAPPQTTKPTQTEQSPQKTQSTAYESHLIPHTAMRKSIADHMVHSKRTAPHVTTVMEADLKRIVAHREANKAAFARDSANLTFSAYFAAATVAALKAFPLVNSSWSDEGVLVHPQINLGIAVSLGAEGLIVPVIRSADGLSLLGLARAINDFADRSRAHRLKPDEVKAGTFTITNHGTGGSLFASPVINQPQCAILGVGAIKKRAVVVEGDAIAVRPMVYLSLTFDHRILDGASADGFLAKIVTVLEEWPD
jgi:pyruvate/2-oxoglutarate dehydrogenase complex dihydrolipoamide acyltransferase (E2) component